MTATMDMTSVIAPKVDQLTADDLLSGPKTVRVRRVEIKPGAEQPINVYYDGDGDKPWRPCKSTARLMVAAWGADAKAYVGRSLTLYRDDKVKWGGMEVGGIRVSHMSHIDSDLVLALTMTKGKKAPTRVKPLKADVAPLKVVTPEPEPDAFDVVSFMSEVANYISTAVDADELSAWWAEKMPLRKQAAGVDAQAARQIAASVTAKINELKGEI